MVATVAADLGVTRVDLAPAGPAPQSGGWPLEARFDIIDLDYGEFVQLPRAPVLRTIEELAAESWDTWTHVHVAMYELRPEGEILVGDNNPVHVHRMTPEWEENGTLDVRDTSVPFAALDAARAAVVGDRTPRDPKIFPVFPGRLPAPLPAPPGTQPGVRVVDGDVTALRDRVADELELAAAELRAVLTEEEYCGAEGAFVDRCAEPEVRVERTFVIHVPTGLPLYRSWRPVEGMPDELAALGLDELVELRATHVRLSTGEHPTPDQEAAVLNVPPVGEVTPTWLPNGVPVFVIHAPSGQVSVVDAVHPGPTTIVRPIQWCPTAEVLNDPVHGAIYAPDGRRLGGPPGSDLVHYRTAPGPAPDTVAVLDRVVPVERNRSSDDSAGLGGCAVAPVFHTDHPDRGRVYRPSEAVAERAEGWVLVDGSIGVDAQGRVWACDEADTTDHDAWRCVTGQVPLTGVDATMFSDSPVWSGVMWAEVDGDGLRRPAHPLIDRLPPEGAPGD